MGRFNVEPASVTQAQHYTDLASTSAVSCCRVSYHITTGCLLQNNTIILMYTLKVIYHLLYSMNNFVTDKSKLPQDWAQVFPYMG